MSAARRERGQSVVEFAVTLPLLLALFLITFEGGRLVFTWVLLSEASREATRVAVLPGTTQVSTIQQRAVNLATIVGVPTSSVTVTKAPVGSTSFSAVSGTFTKSRGETIRISISYTYTVVAAYFIRADWPGLPFTSLPLLVATEMRVEG
jgi:Flp pilus assembly protein TadG